jgi:hypothetical protein
MFTIYWYDVIHSRFSTVIAADVPSAQSLMSLLEAVKRPFKVFFIDGRGAVPPNSSYLGGGYTCWISDEELFHLNQSNFRQKE